MGEWIDLLDRDNHTGQETAADIDAEASTDGQVLTSDGAGNAAWETIPDVTSGASGLAPASGGGTTNYLRADGSWEEPPGGGTHAATHADGGGDAVDHDTLTNYSADQHRVLGVGNTAGKAAYATTGYYYHDTEAGTYQRYTGAAWEDVGIEVDGVTLEIDGTNGLQVADSGIVASTKMNATGTPSSSTFLRGDNQWETPAGGGDVTGPGTHADNLLLRTNGVDTNTLQTTGISIADTTDDITGAGSFNGVTVEDHSARHENGGDDEISVAGLSGQLADAQPSTIQDSTVGQGDAHTLNFGTNLTATVAAGVATITSTGGGASALDDLTDVTITTPATDSVLIKSAGDWIDGTINTDSITDGAVTNAKAANMAANTVKANATAGSADPADLAVGTNTVVGRVAGNIVAAQVVEDQIADDAVTFDKIQNNTPGAVLVYATGLGTPTGSGAGTSGQVLTSNGATTASWQDIPAVARNKGIVTLDIDITAGNTIIPGTNATGTLLDYTDAATFGSDVEIHINGRLQRCGTSGSSEFDVYPAGTASNGDFACEYDLSAGDTIQMFLGGGTDVATALASATTNVDVSAATAPTAGQVLKATSSTAATWVAEYMEIEKSMAVPSTYSDDTWMIFSSAYGADYHNWGPDLGTAADMSALETLIEGAGVRNGIELLRNVEIETIRMNVLGNGGAVTGGVDFAFWILDPSDNTADSVVTTFQNVAAASNSWTSLTPTLNGTTTWNAGDFFVSVLRRGSASVNVAVHLNMLLKVT